MACIMGESVDLYIRNAKRKTRSLMASASMQAARLRAMLVPYAASLLCGLLYSAEDSSHLMLQRCEV